jgi:hypothetical protein
VERDLALTREFLAEKYKDRLEESYKVKYLVLSNSSIYLLICLDVINKTTNNNQGGVWFSHGNGIATGIK